MIVVEETREMAMQKIVVEAIPLDIEGPPPLASPPRVEVGESSSHHHSSYDGAAWMTVLLLVLLMTALLL